MFISPPPALLSQKSLKASIQSPVISNYFNALESFSALEIYAFALMSQDTLTENEKGKT